MRTTVVFLFLLIFSLSAFSQFERNRYQTLKSNIRVSAIKDGVSYVWENKNPNVVLDYKVGNLQVFLNNKDFANANDAPTAPIDSVQTEYEYLLKGILPIDDIIQQLVIKNQYYVELNFINHELGLNHPVQFDLTVTNPGSSQANYRMFSLHGKFDNRQMMLPAFEGFDPDIEIWIGWAAYSIIH